MKLIQEAIAAIAAIPQRPEKDAGDYYHNHQVRRDGILELLKQQDWTPEARRCLQQELEFSSNTGD